MATQKKKFTIKNGEFNLDLAAFKLDGEDLKDYKLSIYSRREADYEETINAISTRENKLKEEKEALKKKYGFFDRLFNKRCRAEMKRINNDLKEIPKSYKQAKMETQYYVIKEFEDKDLTMTAKERKTLASIEKKIHPYIKDEWDRTRQNEKEANAREAEIYKEQDKERTELSKIAVKQQLDLRDQIHKSKVQEAPQKQEAKLEKTVEKVKEDPGLEK